MVEIMEAAGGQIVEARPYDPEEAILLVPFGGQLEPKINREYMAKGFPVQRAEFNEDGSLDTSGYDVSKIKGVVFSGGNDSVHAEGARTIHQSIIDLNVPMLGICYGHQALVDHFGGKVEPGKAGEYGQTKVKIQPHELFDGLPKDEIDALMNHRDVVTELPDGWRAIAESPAGIAAATNDDGIVTVQFHPESNKTNNGNGTQILLNFATKTCGMQPEPGFTEQTYRDRGVEQRTAEIVHQLGGSGVRTNILNSGGVDSATAHAMTESTLRSIGRGDSVQGIYVNNGLMRHEDGDTIRMMQDRGYHIEVQDWSHFFLHEPVPLPRAVAAEMGVTHLPPLDTVVDPKIIRKVVKYGFLEVERRIGAGLRERYSDAEIIALVQGTNLADKIESGDFAGDQIKEHHNSGVEAYVDRLVEPLASFFKGDIRRIAVDLGLPFEIAYRQPFPGPGLALRVVPNATGETVWPEDIEQRRKAVERICQSVGNGALAGCWLPFEATGSQGDLRVHDNVVLLSGRYDPDIIEFLAKVIPENTAATRVLYTPHEVDPDAVTSTQQMITESVLDPLRNAETGKNLALMATEMGGHQLSQHYVASLPVNLRGGSKPTMMSRMFHTGAGTSLEDFVTGDAVYGGRNEVSEGKFLKLLSDLDEVAENNGYDDAVHDVTGKPPGTVELM